MTARANKKNLEEKTVSNMKIPVTFKRKEILTVQIYITLNILPITMAIQISN